MAQTRPSKIHPTPNSNSSGKVLLRVASLCPHPAKHAAWSHPRSSVTGRALGRSFTVCRRGSVVDVPDGPAQQPSWPRTGRPWTASATR
jgi:hypothetical protein